jgi:hypothetical protein
MRDVFCCFDHTQCRWLKMMCKIRYHCLRLSNQQSSCDYAEQATRKRCLSLPLYVHHGTRVAVFKRTAKLSPFWFFCSILGFLSWFSSPLNVLGL